MKPPKYHHYKFSDTIDYLLGYEPALKQRVWVACINHKNKTVTPCHGYYPKHRQGYRSKRLAVCLGYAFIQ